jgi:hypothetical protein
MVKFKVGDKVRVIKLEEIDYGHFSFNEILTVSDSRYHERYSLHFFDENLSVGLYGYQIELVDENYQVETDIDAAIVFLVKNGYTVSKNS